MNSFVFVKSVIILVAMNTGVEYKYAHEYLVYGQEKREREEDKVFLYVDGR